MYRHLSKFSVFLLVFLLVSCQAQSVKTAEYTVKDDLDMPAAHLLAFRENHRLSRMANLQWSGMVDDSLYFVAMAASKDTLYALNCCSGYLRVLPLKHLRSKQIKICRTIYYHNHDSIFFGIERVGMVNMNREFNRNDKDILLVNGKGELINQYSLDSLPDIYSGEYSYGRLYPWDDNVDERLFAGGLLVDAVSKKPYVTTQGFSALNPKIMALCYLENNKIQMLNIRYPSELQEKRYEWPPELWVKVTGPKEMLVGFTVTPYVYRYDLDRDTLVKMNVRYDETFCNTDSAAMVKGTDYPMVLFCKPVWSPVHSCYLRNISFRHYKDYWPSNMVELLDSTFNHIAYVYADRKKGWQDVQCHVDGSITVADRGGYGRHAIQSTGQIRNTRLSVLEKRGMKKKPAVQKEKKEFGMPEYLDKLKFPDTCIVILINLKYPCGPCIQELAQFYRDNSKQLVCKGIYYLFYDPEHQDDSEILGVLRDNGVQNAANIRVDHKLLRRVTKVLSNGKQVEYVQYMIGLRKGHNLYYSLPDFQELTAELQRMAKQSEKNN